MTGFSEGRRTLLLFAVASLAAVAAGCIIMQASDVSPASWMRNLAAWLVGALLAGGIVARGQSRNAAMAILAVASLALAITFVMPPQEGVHRWMDIGPLHINAAGLMLPIAIVALGQVGIWSKVGLGASAIFAALLLMQPDASQLTGFAVAAAILLVRAPAPAAHTAGAVAALLVAAALVWTRPDPLQPVPEVEQIFQLGTRLSSELALLAAAALAAAALSPLTIGRTAGDRKDVGLALAAYFVAVALAPLFGWFPVPLVGLGMSAIVGYWLALGALCARERGSSKKVR
jgi:hypothetical protein